MRTVKFNRWIPVQYETIENKRIKVEGTGTYQKDFPNTGTFHHWGAAYEEFEHGVGNYTVAVVENLDGSIETIHPSDIQFID